jgi:hypothetical protein
LFHILTRIWQNNSKKYTISQVTVGTEKNMFKNISIEPGVMVQTCNPSTWEAEAAG